MRITWTQALAWRLGRHLLDPVGKNSVAQVVHALGALPAQPDTAAELAIGTRRQRVRRNPPVPPSRQGAQRRQRHAAETARVAG